MIWCWILIVPLEDLIFKWIEIDIKATSMHWCSFNINLIIHHLIAMRLWNCPLAFFPIKLHNSKLSQRQRLKSTSRTARFSVLTTLTLKINYLIQMHQVLEIVCKSISDTRKTPGTKAHKYTLFPAFNFSKSCQ